MTEIDRSRSIFEGVRRMKKYYKGQFICVSTPIYRIFEVDQQKHSGLFKYCGFKITSFLHKEMWCLNKKI